ncbi:MAG TPA: helix-turn-helix transcriptional regulator [Alphaproteobacteria bacterium]|jgi:ribosome-binding protein aMBF1 (putative translation factor)|nr:helix-turn-helix transcriptional regulator [Alphaproteobacteria bacterium]
MEEWNEVKQELLKNKKVYKEYKKLELKYAVISQIVGARVNKGVTQKELAETLGTKQSAIARLESGNYNPTLEFLQKTATALGRKLVVSFEL